MPTPSNPTLVSEPGATVVITHRVRPESISDYEAWLAEIGPLCQAAAGHLDTHVVRPIAGLTATFTVIIRSRATADLEAWINSPQRARMIDKAASLLVTGDDFFIRSGLDFWFSPEGAKATVPVRWKQFLLSWSAIYPLVLGTPMLVVPALARLGAPSNLYFNTLCVSGSVVFLMVYVVMPRYTKLVQRWLFR